MRSRRNFIAKGIIAIAGGLFGRRAAVAETKPEPKTLVTEGETLKSSVYKGRPPMEPLDTMIRFERSDDNNERAMTHEILSLIHEEKGKKSYPWTIYAHLTTHHVEGDACVLCSRLSKEDRGWSCGLHSEVFSTAPMVGLGANVEMTNNYAGPEKSLLIGLNIQACGPNDCQYGIQIHGDRGRFEKAIGLNGKGDVGMDIGGRYDVGIDTHANSIRVGEGTCIELDGAGKVRLRYKEGRIEFLNGDRCVGHINVYGSDHEI